MVRRIWIFAGLLGMLSLSLHAATAATIVPASETARTVVVDNLTVKGESVSGTILNKSPKTIRDVELLLRQVWHWADELHPGPDSPGTTLPFTLSGDVAANGSAPFTFVIPPLPERSDGRFVTTMDVVRFSEVGP